MTGSRLTAYSFVFIEHLQTEYIDFLARSLPRLAALIIAHENIFILKYILIFENLNSFPLKVF